MTLLVNVSGIKSKATFKDPLAGTQRFAPDGADGLKLLLGGVALMRSCEGADKHR